MVGRRIRPLYLQSKTILFNPGDTVDAVWFPEGAVISLVVGLATGETVEGAMVGKDGVVGVAAALVARLLSLKQLYSLRAPRSSAMRPHSRVS
jgi:hypothetical protein